MKCKNCPCLCDDGSYEYPEYNCIVFGDDEIYFKEDGCNIHYKEAKKFRKINDIAESGCYWKFEFYDGTKFKDFSELTEEEQNKYIRLDKYYSKVFVEHYEYRKHLLNKYKEEK